MRIVLVGNPDIAAVQGRMLARLLGVPYLAPRAAVVARELASHTAGFVLDRFPMTPMDADALDAFLRSRGAELDVVLHLDSARYPAPAGSEALLDHYLGRIVEVDADGDVTLVHERALDGLREALVAA